MIFSTYLYCQRKGRKIKQVIMCLAKNIVIQILMIDLSKSQLIILRNLSNKKVK